MKKQTAKDVIWTTKDFGVPSNIQREFHKKYERFPDRAEQDFIGEHDRVPKIKEMEFYNKHKEWPSEKQAAKEGREP